MLPFHLIQVLIEIAIRKSVTSHVIGLPLFCLHGHVTAISELEIKFCCDFYYIIISYITIFIFIHLTDMA